MPEPVVWMALYEDAMRENARLRAEVEKWKALLSGLVDAIDRDCDFVDETKEYDAALAALQGGADHAP